MIRPEPSVDRNLGQVDRNLGQETERDQVKEGPAEAPGSA